MVRKRGIRILLYLILVLALVAAVSTAADYLLNTGPAATPAEGDSSSNDNPPADSWRPFWPEAPLIPRPEKIKGIYVNGTTVVQGRFPELMDLIERTELNSMVVDFKDDNGRLTYSRTAVPWAAEAGVDAGLIGDPVSFIKLLEQHGIYPIARIVAFKDSAMAPFRPSLAVKNSGGMLWRDGGGDYWLDPYNREAWKYIVAVAREAAQLGFREIQFDYVRFPETGNLGAAVYPAADGAAYNEVIPAFLRYARASLAEYDVKLSVDIFGLVTVDPGGMGIGQHLESIAGAVDIICPMLYPSTFEAGNLGLANPVEDPYGIVYLSLAGAQRRLDQAGISTELRPWLQSYSYGAPGIRAQINAARDQGVYGFTLWNMGNYYNADALNPAGTGE